MQEDISGIRIIKACVREIYEKVRFKKANDDLIKTQLQVLIIFAFMNPIINALMYVVVAVILLVGSLKLLVEKLHQEALWQLLRILPSYSMES